MILSNDSSRQKKYMILSAFFPQQALISAILVTFYLRHLNLTLSQYLYLDSLLFITVAITELPSGFISDYFGRKRILILSKFLVLASMINLLLSSGFEGGLISIIILAIGMSLGSGNEESILYEYFTTHDTIDNYRVINSNKNSILLIMTSIYSIASGFIFKQNISMILYLDIIIMVINIAITTLFLVDMNPKGIKTKNCKGLKNKTTKIHIKNVINTLPVFVTMALLFTFFRVTFNYYQPIYEYCNLPVESFGFFPVFFNLLAALGSQLYIKFFKNIKSQKAQITLIGIILLLSSFGIYLMSTMGIAIIGMIFIQQIIRGIQISLQPIAINSCIPKDTAYRTSYISFFSMINTLVVSLFVFLSGITVDYFNLIKALFIISVSILSVLFLINTMTQRINK